MAQSWETSDIQKQGDAWKKANEQYQKYKSIDSDLGRQMAASYKSDMDAASTEANKLRNALGYSTTADGSKVTAQWSTQQQQPVQPYMQNYTSMINDSQQKLVDALRAKVQQSIAEQQQNAQSSINSEEVNRGNNLRSVLEQNANNGDRGGVGRQLGLNTQTNADNNEIAIRNTLANNITNLNNSMNSTIADYNANSLDKLLAQANSDRTFNYQTLRDQISDTGKLADGTYTQSGLLNKLNIEAQQLQNSALPQQIKDQATLLQQQIQSGKIGIDEAQYKLKELTDPNSVTNKTANIELQIKQLELKNLPEQQKLELQQLRKQIAQIGAAPYRSPEQIQQDQLQVQLLQKQVDNLNAGLTKDGKSTTPLPKSNDSLYNSTYNSLYKSYISGAYTDQQIKDNLTALQGLTPQQKADIYNAIVPD